MRVLFCHYCGYRAEPGTSLTGKCPDCDVNFHVIHGTEEEITRHIKWYLDRFDAIKQCPGVMNKWHTFLERYESSHAGSFMMTQGHRDLLFDGFLAGYLMRSN